MHTSSSNHIAAIVGISISIVSVLVCSGIGYYLKKKNFFNYLRLRNNEESNESQSSPDNQAQSNSHSEASGGASADVENCPWLMSPSENQCTCEDRLHERYANLSASGSGLNFLGKKFFDVHVLF